MNTILNDLNDFIADLKADFPLIGIEVDPPNYKEIYSGDELWFIDIITDSERMVIEWHPNGITALTYNAKDVIFGDQSADATFDTLGEASYAIKKYLNKNQSLVTCQGCGRKELHKLCPAWGTDYYMSGIFFSPELEAGTLEERSRRRAEYSDKTKNCCLD